MSTLKTELRQNLACTTKNKKTFQPILTKED